MDSITIHAGATVFDANGDKLGKVHAVEPDQFVVEKGFFFPTDYIVPISMVTRASEDEIHLSVTKDEAVDRSDEGMASDTTPIAGSGATGTLSSRYDTVAADPAVTAQGDVLRVPVHEEELTATTRPVEQGSVRITKDVVAEDRTLEVPVTEERARVTRRTVDREATEVGADAFQEQTIEVPLRTEQVDVQKRVRVGEEVEITKDAVQRTEQVSDTVRREEVRVEDQTTGADVNS